MSCQQKTILGYTTDDDGVWAWCAGHQGWSFPEMQSCGFAKNLGHAACTDDAALADREHRGEAAND